MPNAATKAFDGALNVTYRGFKKLLLFIVIVAVGASICTFLAITLATAVLR